MSSQCKKCGHCGKEFCKNSITSQRTWDLITKFCSRECGNLARRGIPMPEEQKEKRRGKTPWNKGKIGLIVAWNKGKEFPQTRNEKNGLWKGDEASAVAIHNWVRRRKPNPFKCEFCGIEHRKMYHLANMSGEYPRDIDDYKWLCVPCHKKYDMNKIEQFGRTERSIKLNSKFTS
jgi:hypothetical protein